MPSAFISLARSLASLNCFSVLGDVSLSSSDCVSIEIYLMNLSVIFEEKPDRWGFRGDPYFWDHLNDIAKNMDLISPDELEQLIKEEYLSLSGKALTDEYMDFAVIQQFAHGGMSSGGVDNRWWMREGIPLLKRRLNEFMIEMDPGE
jgi:molybdenum cofactor cytidylyltransferase